MSSLRGSVPLLVIAAVLLTVLISPPGAHAATPTDSLSIAGSVSVSPSFSQYFDVQVLDSSSGGVYRSQPLDATCTFAFTGLSHTVNEVRLFPRLPERRLRLDVVASSLSVRIPKDSSGNNNNNNNTDNNGIDSAAWLHLTAVVEDVNPAAVKGPGVVTATVTVVGVVAVFLGRHWILSLLRVPSIKAPKPRKMIVMGSR